MERDARVRVGMETTGAAISVGVAGGASSSGTGANDGAIINFMTAYIAVAASANINAIAKNRLPNQFHLILQMALSLITQLSHMINVARTLKTQ
jgi:hypothetical protein